MKVIVEILYLGDGSDPVGGTGLRFFGVRHLFELGILRAFGGTDQFLPWVALAFRL